MLRRCAGVLWNGLLGLGLLAAVAYLPGAVGVRAADPPDQDVRARLDALEQRVTELRRDLLELYKERKREELDRQAEPARPVLLPGGAAPNRPPQRLSPAQRKWLQRLPNYQRLRQNNSDADIVWKFAPHEVRLLEGDELPHPLDPGIDHNVCRNGICREADR